MKKKREPMSYPCQADLTVFDECFSHPNIGMSDVDGHVERRGQFLWYEEKPRHGQLCQAQEISARQLTKSSTVHTYLAVQREGDHVFHYEICHNGRWYKASSSSMDNLKDAMKVWDEAVTAGRNGGEEIIKFAVNDKTDGKTA